MPDLFVTNFNRNFTGVSSTTANVVRAQRSRYDMRLVGVELPDCPAPLPVRMARALSVRAPNGKPFAIWHVRRNTEMRAAIWTRDVLRLPIKLVFTSAAQRRHSAFPRWLISRMDAIVATSDLAADFVPNVRAVVPHGVDTDVFHPSENRAASWAEQDAGGTMAIATIGRIRPEKGTDVFVDAMLRLLPDLPGAIALVIGRAGGKHDPFLDGLKARVNAAGLTDRIRFTGEAPAHRLPAIMRSLSLVMQMPRYEGYGMVPLEAMASGVPFVASDAGFYREFSADGRTGFVVDMLDAKAAADAAKALLSDSARFDATARAARDMAMKRFSAEQEADGIGSVYEELWSKT
ncbi:MAG: glycosyltransferase family 4 protein [Aliishimia sp.]